MSDHENVLRDLLLECGVEGVTLWHIRCLASYLAAGGVSRQPRSEARQRLAADLTCSHDDEMRVLADWDDARWTAERSRGGVVWAGGFDDDSATRWRLWRTTLNRHLLQRGVRSRGRDGFRDGRWGEWETVEAIDGPTSEAIRIASALVTQNSPRSPPPAAPDVVPHASTHKPKRGATPSRSRGTR